MVKVGGLIEDAKLEEKIPSASSSVLAVTSAETWRPPIESPCIDFVHTLMNCVGSTGNNQCCGRLVRHQWRRTHKPSACWPTTSPPQPPIDLRALALVQGWRWRTAPAAPQSVGRASLASRFKNRSRLAWCRWLGSDLARERIHLCRSILLVPR